MRGQVNGRDMRNRQRRQRRSLSPPDAAAAAAAAATIAPIAVAHHHRRCRPHPPATAAATTAAAAAGRRTAVRRWRRRRPGRSGMTGTWRCPSATGPHTTRAGRGGTGGRARGRAHRGSLGTPHSPLQQSWSPPPPWERGGECRRLRQWRPSRRPWGPLRWRAPSATAVATPRPAQAAQSSPSTGPPAVGATAARRRRGGERPCRCRPT